MMKKTTITLCIAIAAIGMTACSEKNKSDNIITHKEVKKEPAAPIKMQEYNQTTEITLGGSELTCFVHRAPDDSLAMVKDETGQAYLDNVIDLKITRAGGSVFFQKRFTKTAFDSFLDDDYRNTGILEGLVFDKAEGGVLRFAASVSHPNTDEYIPILIKIDRNGNIKMERDVNLDTTSEEEEEDGV